MAICQPGIPHYRTPLYELLAQSPTIELTVFAPLLEGNNGYHERQACNFSHEHAAIHSSRWVPGIKYQRAMLDVIDPKRFDIVVLMWDVHYVSLWRALHRANQCQIPVVLWGHGYSKRASWWRNAVRHAAGRRADAVMTYCETTAKELVTKFRYDSRRVYFAQNALDQSDIQAAKNHWLEKEHQLADFRDCHDLKTNRTVIFVSRLDNENRADLLIHATKLALKEFPSLKLVIVGDGQGRHGLECLTKELGISNHVIFTGKIYDEDELAPWMLSSTLFCYPSNLGLSILHAFGYGLPVVTGDDITAHNPEIEAMKNGHNGLFFRDGDIEDMVAKWRTIFHSPDTRRRMSANALGAVLTQYNLDNMVKGFLEVSRLSMSPIPSNSH